MAARATRRSVAMVGLAAVSVAITVGAIGVSRTQWETRYLSTGWSTSESIIFGAGWASVALLLGVGLALWWQRPSNATGRWLWIAGAALGLWFVGTYWNSGWGYVLQYTLLAFRPALAMVFLGWPMGRPSRAVTRWIAVVGILYTATTVAITVLAGGAPDARWADDPVGRFAIEWVGLAFGPVNAWLLLFVPALVVIVLLVRQQRSVAAETRWLLLPVTVAGIVTFGTDLVMMTITTLGADLLYDSVHLRSTTLGVIVLTENYAQGAVAAIGVGVATIVRRRSSPQHAVQTSIDLGRFADAQTPSAAVRRLLGDETARLLYRSASGSLIDADGVAAEIDERDRVRVPVRDGRGDEICVLDGDAALARHPVLLDVAAATIVHGVENERATAIARARRTELVAVQHALLDATDTARRRLERDLHDGAQQGLVGLALAARLLARDPSPSGVAAFERELEQTRRDLVSLLDDGPPAVLASGLAAALHTLAATTPILTDVRLRGDVDGDAAEARTLWLVANEAVANCVKHARAAHILLDLRVDASGLTMAITDDGIGGVATVPSAIAKRVSDAGGSCAIDSGPGHGTTIAVTLAPTRAEIFA